MGSVSVVVFVLGIIIAAALGFGACYLWMRSLEVQLKTAQSELLSAKAEELARLKAAQEHELSEKDAELAARQSELAERDARIGELEGEVETLTADLRDLRITDELNRYSDFQLLGLCDVYDAEQEEGFLRRAYGDPAMEQLMNLGMVGFDMPHDEGRDRLPRWTLTQDARRFTKLCREQMDARTEAIRARRDAKKVQ